MSGFFTVENMHAVMGGRWLARAGADDVACTGVGIDTRGDVAGKAFFAIVGDRFDGHEFLQQATDAGAVLLVIDREPEQLPAGVSVLLVDDTRYALGMLAAAYRRLLADTTVIAVTGSAGKTTTKALIHAVLSSQFTGTCARSSFNNDIGVPLTILSASPSDRYLILELGTNAPGEIDGLAAMAQPHVAVITLVGRSHLEGLGSIEAVAAEKAAMLRYLPQASSTRAFQSEHICGQAPARQLQQHGLAIVHADSPQLQPYLDDDAITFGEGADAKLRLTDRGSDEVHWWLEVNGEERFALSLAGRHNAVNAIAAVAVGRAMGLDDATISAALAETPPPAMRFVAQRYKGITFYNDAYNANPDSMIASLSTFVEVAAGAGRRVIILGDMLELGEQAAALHREVGRHLAKLHQQSDFAKVILIGPLAAHMGQWLSNDELVVTVPELTKQAIAEIHGMLCPGDAVLIKGSRSCGLERVLKTLPSPDEVVMPIGGGGQQSTTVGGFV